MLSCLILENYLLFSHQSVEFSRGFNTVTGETGAGKSLLLDALSFVFGGKIDKQQDVKKIRPTAQMLSVSAALEVKGVHFESLYTLLSEHDLIPSRRDSDSDSDNDSPSLSIILRRTLKFDGQSRCYINDKLITLGLLRTLAINIIDMQGQFASVLEAPGHTLVKLLDDYGLKSAQGKSQQHCGDGLSRQQQQSFADLLAGCEEAYAHWQRCCYDVDTLREQASRQTQEYAQLRELYQVFKEVEPQNNEVEHLGQQRLRLRHAQRLHDVCARLRVLLKEQSQLAVLDTLRILDRDPDIAALLSSELRAKLDCALDAIADAISLVDDATVSDDDDQRDLGSVESRLFALEEIARRAGVASSELSQKYQSLRDAVESYGTSGESLADAEKLSQRARHDYLRAAVALSRRRRSLAVSITRDVTKYLQKLHMEKGSVMMKVISEHKESLWKSHGLDGLHIMVSTVADTPPQPMGKIASGGERARILLAFRAALGEAAQTSIQVFDEIDRGLGGAVASSLGQTLQEIGEHTQVITITHAPQVAAHAHTHFKVERESADTSRVSVLDSEGQVEEITRMISAHRPSVESRSAALRMLQELRPYAGTL